MAQEINLAALANAKKAEEEPKQELTEVTPDLTPVEFTPEERTKIEEIKSSIDFMDSQSTIQYGIGAQRKMTEFADSILTTVKTKDGGEVGNLLSDLAVQVKSLEVEKLLGEDGITSKLPILKNAVNGLRKLKERYSRAEVSIDRIEAALEKSRMEMLKDVSVFDMMYQENLNCFHELELYIAAGKERIAEIQGDTLPKLRAEAAATGNPMDAQLVKDFEDTVDRFEKKIYDLELSRTIAIQSAPQIKLIQNNDRILVEKIQTAILNTIPIWKSQFVIAMGLSNQQKVLKMQREITDATNEMLVKNAELLKTNTIETAKESNRGIVDIETLQKVNENLLATIDETIKIQKEGKEKRQAAEVELNRIENELKNKLIEVRG
ncbi:MAG: toxic anion resistance protein [Lachnospiraceae bacterium]|nr:toxic anion resistance protein [Lachnospiraceae bacterium]MBP3506730.1 toxic anion resistance protein [Lachnospiraceae bacterium]